MTFRQAYISNITERLKDVLLHAVFAIVLPGPYWLQWLPDVLVPALFIHGVLTNRLLPVNSKAMAVHNLLHSIVIPGVLLLVPHNMYSLHVVGVHWAAHVIIDRFTHDRWNRTQ